MSRYPSKIFRLIWFCNPGDFNKCKEYFSKQTLLPDNVWKSFDDTIDCIQYIKEELNKKIFLISAGSKLVDIIEKIHSIEQLHSIYIYCHQKNNYEYLLLNYEKTQGIYDNPINLLDDMCEHIKQQILQLETDNLYTNIEQLSSSFEQNHFDLPCIFNNELKSYSLPNTLWSSTMKSLPIKGQGTIEIWLKGPILFEIRLSNKLNINDNDTNEYAIVLKTNYRTIELETSSLNKRSDTIDCYQIIQNNNQYWYCYWLTFWSENRIIQYGIGEIRPKFKLFKVLLPEQDKSLIETIAYLHIKINDSTNMNDKMKIFIGKEPIIFEPPLVIISPRRFSITNCENYFGLHGQLLSNPLKYLYEQCLNFTLIDNQFPDFIKAIERSIQNPQGWCYKTLLQKIDHFGHAREQATYLCLLINHFKNQFSFIMKIWPANHYTPIHEYENIYSIIRIVYGEILVKYFPILSIHHPQDMIIEQMFQQDSITWMTPKLNHIYQMKNLERNTNQTCSITIECIHHTISQQTFSEQFTYLSYPESRIENHYCKPDESYTNFKQIMHNEWTEFH